MTREQPNLLSELPPLLSIEQTAELLHLTRRSVMRLLSERRLASTKLTRSRGPGGRRLILRSSLEKMVQLGIDDD